MFILPPLPPEHSVESLEILRKAAVAHRHLAELKGLSASIPNQNILVNTLSLQEARDSSAVENIVTTDDLLYQEIHVPDVVDPAAKEIRMYSAALRIGYALVRDEGVLRQEHLLAIHRELAGNDAGIRRLPGTTLKNAWSGEVVYTPPQDRSTIDGLMDNLFRFMNDDGFYSVDPLIKMALLHYQFESIHPFYDGNGRAGRILNVLYLVQKGLLDIPILYLSRYVIRNKAEYYRLLQAVRERGAWEEWIMYMLDAVADTSVTSLRLVVGIRDAMQRYKQGIRTQFRFYSQDLINNLFAYPYTRIDYIQRDLKVTRLTATKYLNDLAAAGFLEKRKAGRASYYINTGLLDILTSV
jgi:Fic family protein